MAKRGNFRNRRTILINDDDWKVLGDVAEAMGLGDGRGPGRADLIARLTARIAESARNTEPDVVRAGNPVIVFVR